MSVTTKQVLKYMLLPGIVPQMRELMGGGAGYIALYLAQIYAAVRLLPYGHPYLNPANRGRFGIHNVVVAAAGRLKFKKENCDQIIIFFLMLVGMIVFAMQFMLLGLTLFMQAAHASGLPTNFAGFFITPAPADNDIAFVLLDRVFGVPQLFLDTAGNGSCVEQGTACFATVGGVPLNLNAQPEGAYPWPFHIALRAMMQFYSIGLLVIGLLIFLYFTVTVVMETAQDGVPFGRRFNHVWAPIRMVVALGLLIPVANGLNAAQYITLYAAYWGSGFATNGWNLFIAKAVPNPIGGPDTPAGDVNTLIATPNQPEMTNLLQFYTANATCYAAYWTMISDPKGGIDIESYLVRPAGDPTGNHLKFGNNESFDQAVTWMHYHDIDIRYGSCTKTCVNGGVSTQVDCDAGGAGTCTLDYPGEKGNVKPLCGEVILPLEGSMDPTATTNPDPGAYFLAQQWWELTEAIWMGHNANAGPCTPNTFATGRSCWTPYAPGVGNADPLCKNWAGGGGPITQATIGAGDPFTNIEQWGYCFVDRYAYDPPDTTIPIPTNADLKAIINSDPTSPGLFNQDLGWNIQQAVLLSATTNQWNYIEAELGWAGAGLWYHQIARINGAMINALDDMPHVLSYPTVMEDIKKSRAKSDKNSSGDELYRPVASTDQHPEGTKTDSQGDKIASVLWQSYDIWNHSYNVNPGGNWISDLIKAVTGTTGLFALTDPNNINVHPLALLVGIGKSMMNAALWNLAGATGGTVLSRIFGLAGASQIIDPLANFAFSLGMICVGIGILLYYIVPFMPFLYYFFAVGTWIKGVFEAMVGVPLWALAHIHIDGEGLPGTYAMAGYLMIMEIFLRPILIVFGLLASVVLFAAQVRVLHDIWQLVTTNLTGFNTDPAVVTAAGNTGSLSFYRDPIDEFFFTVIYAIVVYMLGMSSFKLITQIPSRVIRWMGTAVDAFDDGGSELAESFKGKMQGGVGKASGALKTAFSESKEASKGVNPLGVFQDGLAMGGTGQGSGGRGGAFKK